jgi:hypothetical protein
MMSVSDKSGLFANLEQIELLQAHADRIAADYIPDGALIVELGSG